MRSRRRLYPVGRLDADSTGLILLTNDGELADLLTHPALRRREGLPGHASSPAGCPRATLAGACATAWSSTTAHSSAARVRQVAPGVVEITLREGRKRQVRRMCEAVGHRVVALERVAFGPLGLRGLERGQSRRLTDAEVERLRRAAASPPPPKRTP